MTLNLIDVIIIIIYCLVILYIGFFTASSKKDKKETGIDDFLLAGRKVTLPLFVATLVATWYGNILGVGEFVFTSGISAWVCFGLPYYIAALIFAALIAKRIRMSSARTIPEQISLKFGSSSALFASFVVLVITIPAAYILMLGVMINIFTGWGLWLSMIIGTVISLIFLFTGGFKADILTNAAQFILMYIGFAVLLFFTVSKYGFDIEFLKLLPDNHLSFFGGYSWQIILSWYIIAFQTFIDPSFHQRCAAARTPKTAQRGIVVSVIFWIIFDFLTLSAGLYAKAYLIAENPIMAFPLLGESVLPAFWKGIFIISLLATIMSTLDSYSFISATTIGYDIGNHLKSKFKLIASIPEDVLVKIGLAITGVLGILIAILIPSAIQIIYKTASIAVPGLLIPLLLTYSSKYYINLKNILKLIVIPVISSFIWTIGTESEKSDLMGTNIFILFEPMIIGILVSILLAMIYVKKVKVL